MTMSSPYPNFMAIENSQQREYEKQLQKKLASNNTSELLDRLKGKPFWIWDSVAEHRRQYVATNRNCCFNHIIGLPKKEDKEHPLYPYERDLFEALQKHKQVWVLKATGLGVTEFMLRYMAWLCIKDDKLKGSSMCIVTAPRIELAIELMGRMKELFRISIDTIFDTKETVIELNSVHIEAYPSHHLDSMRGIANVSFIYLDEADFFPPGQQVAARTVSERYIAKSNPEIVMVSTPNKPGGLFERIEQEKDCLYHRIKLDYTHGLDKIYSEADIVKAKASPSFEQEYNLKYLGLVGDAFHIRDIDAAIEKGRELDPATYQISSFTSKSMGIDPGFGSSPLGVCITELTNGGCINVLFADEYTREDFGEMIDLCARLVRDYGLRFRDNDRIFTDGSNAAFTRALKQVLHEDVEYERAIKHLKDSYGTREL